MRPTSLDNYFGQEHLVGKGAVLRRMIETGNLSSFILWGPPGVGKTTLAKIVAKQLNRPFHTLSAISSGVKDIRDVIEKSKGNNLFNPQIPILFIVHRNLHCTCFIYGVNIFFILILYCFLKTKFRIKVLYLIICK